MVGTSEPGWPSLLTTEMRRALDAIREQAGRAVSQQLLINYTDHTLGHLDRVAANFLALTDGCKRGTPNLNEYEAFCALAACYLHDVALQSTVETVAKNVDELTKDEREEIRKKHAINAHNWVIRSVSEDPAERAKQPELGLRLHDVSMRLAGVIAVLCKQHSGPAEPIGKLTNHNFNSKEIRVGLLCHLLRLADALDLDERRVDMRALEQRRISPESQLHWWRHHYTDSVKIEPNGRIRIQLSFPEKTHPKWIDLFAAEISQYVERELLPAQDLFIDNNIPFFLVPPQLGAYAAHKRQPTAALEDLLAKKEVILAAVQHQAEIPAQASRKGRYYQEAWSCRGYPWSDLPVTFQQKEFVQTTDLKEKFAEIEWLLQGPKGELRLVYGTRGAGKTSFLESLRERYSGKANVIHVNLSRASGRITTHEDLYRWIFHGLYYQMTPTALTRDIGPEHFREALAHLPREKTIILIDNIDRYSPEPDLKLISRFFGLAQGNLEVLKTKALVLISATTDWRGTLSTSDLSYLGRDAFLEIQPFTTSDAQELLEKRLQLVGSEFSNVFTAAAARIICQFAEGNPRAIINAAAKLCDVAIAAKASKVDANLAKAELSTELTLKLSAKILDVAKQSPENAAALQHLYHFALGIGKTGIPEDQAWDVVTRLASAETLRSSTLPLALSGTLGDIAEHIAGPLQRDGTWKLRKEVRHFLDALAEAELPVVDFVAIYRTRPLTWKDTGKPRELANVKHYNKTVETYMLDARKILSDLEHRAGPASTILLKCHFAMERVVLALLAWRQVPLHPHYVTDHSEGFVLGSMGQPVRKADNKLIWESHTLQETLNKALPKFPCFAELNIVLNRSRAYFGNHHNAATLSDTELQAMKAATRLTYDQAASIFGAIKP